MPICHQCSECPEQDLGPPWDEESWQAYVDADGNPVNIPGYPLYALIPHGAKAFKRKAFVEAAPSHDPSKPCFAAYSAVYRVSEEFDDEPPAHRRPLYGIRVYDVTSQAGDPNRIRDVAAKINAATTPVVDEFSDCFGVRFEVVGLPLADDTESLTDHQKARVCANYDDEERWARMATGDTGFYVPLQLDGKLFRRALLMIDRLDAGSGWEKNMFENWEDGGAGYPGPPGTTNPGRSPYGSVSVVSWQPRMSDWEEDDEPLPPPDKLHLLKFPLETLPLLFDSYMELRSAIRTFYVHFVGEGRMDQELKRAKEAAQKGERSDVCRRRARM
ncbi:hypothetical protein GE09DRAFT_1137962 [Coniochaeta sp. 2T2.1]|nr:hypothetical protein GE09DRAFT_1137962 [Coniochaeta sp. 2T2.1]